MELKSNWFYHSTNKAKIYNIQRASGFALTYLVVWDVLHGFDDTSSRPYSKSEIEDCFGEGSWVFCNEDGSPLESETPVEEEKYPHYYKDVRHLDYIDVYRVLDLFEVTDGAIAHAIKKLLVAGGRGNKDAAKDIQEAIDSLIRKQKMVEEDNGKADSGD